VEERVIIHPGQGLRQHSSRFRLIALVAVLAIGATAAFHHYRQTANDARLAKLADIVGTHRLTRARLSSGFAFAPCQVDSSADRLVRGLVCEGPPPTSWTSAAGLREFAGSMRSDDQDESPDSHGMGIWQLVMGHADDAVADLRAAARREPKNAQVLNDLAVGLTEVAQVHDDPSMLIDAYVAADSAVRLDASLPEAQFTLAVLLEQLYLRTDAVAAWTRYLELDGKSPWAAEARSSLATLQPREDQWGKTRERLLNAVSASAKSTVDSIVAMYPSETRALIQDQLGEWGAAIVAGDTAKARSLLDFARALAEPLRVATSDPFMVDAVASIDRTKADGDRTRFRALAEGHVALAEGTSLWTARKHREADVQLTIARRQFAFGASPMTAWASLVEGRLQLAQLNYDAALETFTSIRRAAPSPYAVLRSTAMQYVGFIFDTRSDYVHSVAAYDSTLAESRTTGDPMVALRVGSWLSEAASVLRGKQAGWRALYAALAETPRYAATDRAVYSVVTIASLVTGNDAPRLSLRYRNELIQIARHVGDPAIITVALRRRAEQLAKMGEVAPARADIAGALAAAREIRDTTTKKRAIDIVTLVSAHMDVESSPREAEIALERVVDTYRTAHYERDLGTAYLYLAQSRVALGNLESARAAFDSATDVMQRQRATVTSGDERGAFLDDARATIDQVVTFHAGHNAKDAFEYFEQTRARVLLEQLTVGRAVSPNPQSAVLESLQRALSDSDVVLSYAVLPRETLVWTIGRNRFELHHIAATAPEIEDLVSRLQQALRGPSARTDTAASQRLYGLLLQTAGHIDREAKLIVIPDRWLDYVPFAALRDPSTGRFLVQDHSVIYAPSATLLMESLRQPRERFSPSSRVLAIGNPKFDSRVFQLPDLPAATREAETIAGLYDHQQAVVGVDATDTALERMAPSFDILHFAGHAEVGRDAPQRSHLVLASDGHSDGAVFASEIAQWKLPRMRLAILSGCSTGDGKLSATEGASSLARAFFSAGVPAVLSSLWAIDDNETADFFIAFHRRLVQGHSSAVALRETQIEWLGDAKSRAHPVSSWAAFQLFGG
jgi:CHAT domain-containing protein